MRYDCLSNGFFALFISMLPYYYIIFINAVLLFFLIFLYKFVRFVYNQNIIQSTQNFRRNYATHIRKTQKTE